MNRNLDGEWVRRMAEKEDGCCVSVGGLVSRIRVDEQEVLDEPVTRDWLLSLPGCQLDDRSDLYSPVVFRNDFLELQFSEEDGTIRGWAVTRIGTGELRCRITRANVLVLLTAFGPPMPEDPA